MDKEGNSMEDLNGTPEQVKDPKEIALDDLALQARVMSYIVMDEDRKKNILAELNDLANSVAAGGMSPEDAKARARIITDIKSKENRGQ